VQDFPHHYLASASLEPQAQVEVSSPGLSQIRSGPPVEFGGKGDLWSPETLLVAAIADCFVLSFSAIARASRFEWLGLSCEAEGTLDRVDGVTRFTAFAIRPCLELSADADPEKAKRLLEKAEKTCLVTNSLSGTTSLEPSLKPQS
jgi:peroxiredoxin-like protein